MNLVLKIFPPRGKVEKNSGKKKKKNGFFSRSFEKNMNPHKRVGG